MNQIERDKLKARLERAEEAYHLLMTGEKEVTITYDGNRSVTFNQISIDRLSQYIAQLKSQIGSAGGKGTRRRAVGVNF